MQPCNLETLKPCNPATLNLKPETLNRIEREAGQLNFDGTCLKFSCKNAAETTYSNAQLDDYRHLPRRKFLHRPPLTLTVRARFSHSADELRGTAGFGFWNDPFLMTGIRPPTLPRAVWFFFASPPSNMPLAANVPGFGWKAATINALRPQFAALLPLAPIAVPLMNLPSLRRLWRIGQRAAQICEKTITAPMTDWHTYTIRWQKNRVRFMIDGQSLLTCPVAIPGALGFVMWLDNQYMVAAPWGRFRWGTLATAEQWMEVAQLKMQKEK